MFLPLIKKHPPKYGKCPWWKNLGHIFVSIHFLYLHRNSNFILFYWATRFWKINQIWYSNVANCVINAKKSIHTTRIVNLNNFLTLLYQIILICEHMILYFYWKSKSKYFIHIFLYLIKYRKTIYERQILLNNFSYKRCFIIEKQLRVELWNTPNVFYTPLPFYATQIINP